VYSLSLSLLLPPPTSAPTPPPLPGVSAASFSFASLAPDDDSNSLGSTATVAQVMVDINLLSSSIGLAAQNAALDADMARADWNPLKSLVAQTDAWCLRSSVAVGFANLFNVVRITHGDATATTTTTTAIATVVNDYMRASVSSVVLGVHGVLASVGDSPMITHSRVRSGFADPIELSYPHSPPKCAVPLDASSPSCRAWTAAGLTGATRVNIRTISIAHREKLRMLMWSSQSASRYGRQPIACISKEDLSRDCVRAFLTDPALVANMIEYNYAYCGPHRLTRCHPDTFARNGNDARRFAALEARALTWAQTNFVSTTVAYGIWPIPSYWRSWTFQYHLVGDMWLRCPEHYAQQIASVGLDRAVLIDCKVFGTQRPSAHPPTQRVNTIEWVAPPSGVPSAPLRYRYGRVSR
jgi:hypothetical protein